MTRARKQRIATHAGQLPQLPTNVHNFHNFPPTFTNCFGLRACGRVSRTKPKKRKLSSPCQLASPKKSWCESPARYDADIGVSGRNTRPIAVVQDLPKTLVVLTEFNSYALVNAADALSGVKKVREGPRRSSLRGWYAQALPNCGAWVVGDRR